MPGLISPYSEASLDTAAYDLALGREVFVTPLASDTAEDRRKTYLEPNQDFEIPPSRFAFLTTEERVTVPENALAFISLKFKKKARGLVNVSGFHVDPGYKGKLIFTVFNAGGSPIRIERGQPMFSIWYADLDTKDDSPFNRAGYSSLPADLIDLPNLGDSVSIPQLKQNLDDLRGRVSEMDAKIRRIEPKALLIYAILTAVTFSVLTSPIKKLIQKWSNASAPITEQSTEKNGADK